MCVCVCVMVFVCADMDKLLPSFVCVPYCTDLPCLANVNMCRVNHKRSEGHDKVGCVLICVVCYNVWY